MNNKKLNKAWLPAAVASLMIGHAQAGVTLYEQEGTSVATDGFFNTFYVASDQETTGAADRSQARVKMGFLPNYLGTTFSKQSGDLTLGGRASFWVTINDANSALTDSMIDTRQFYATVSGGFGEILVGKDFALFGRTNILSDEILMGYGQTVTTGVDGQNVSFGNIGSGYLYPFPNAQITYRTPDMGGLKIAVGLMDPAKSNATSEEGSPRIEAEAVFSNSFDGGSYKAWLGVMRQSSEQPGGGGKVDSSGVAYGISATMAGFSLTASGFQADGVGTAGLGNLITADKADVDGLLLQASYRFGSERLVVSRGENEGNTTGTGSNLDLETSSLAWFHSVNDSLTLVGEYSKSESDATEVRSIALGAVVSF